MSELVNKLKTKLGVRANTTDEEDSTTQTVTIIVSVLFLVAYLAINITGTVYYVKLTNMKPSPVSKGLMDWNLASVILGYLLFPLLNLSSPITFAAIKK